MSKTQVLKGPKPDRKEIKLPPGMTVIEECTERHAANYTALANTMAELEGKIASLKADYLPTLRTQADRVKMTHAALNSYVLASPELFTKPRTRVMHGFEVGYRKGKGVTSFADEARAIELIKKHFPDQADVLIAVKESIVKDAAAQLAAADLKKIGGDISDAVDQVVIKSATGDVTKLVDALLKEDGK